jgi:hypothetical protein
MLHYYVVILHAWLLHFFTVLYFSYYGMVTYYPILFIFCKHITLFFIQHYIVRELFNIIVVFYYRFVFANWPLFLSCYYCFYSVPLLFLEFAAVYYMAHRMFSSVTEGIVLLYQLQHTVSVICRHVM